VNRLILSASTRLARFMRAPRRILPGTSSPSAEKYCFDCYADEKKPKGGVNLERFRDEAAVLRDRETTQAAAIADWDGKAGAA